MIYFDHNATTPLDDAVFDAMQPFLKRFYGNPSSLYRLGRLSRTAIETAREQVAEFVGVHSSQVVFTSGGTESNNLALAQLAPGHRCVASAIEHPSVLAVAPQNKPIATVPVNRQGQVIDVAIDDMGLDANDFISIMRANNETGVIQDIAPVFARLREQGIVCHTDAVQAAGKIALDFDALNTQLMSLSSHKLYGPKGCGALIAARDFALKPLLRGGSQESGIRAGTENVAAIIGFGKACELAKSELESRWQLLLQLRLHLEAGLKKLPGCVIFSEKVDRLPNTVQFSIAGVDGEMLQMQLDQKNIAVSSASACSSGGGEPSAVLLAMGVDVQTAKGAIRVSLGKANTMQEIDTFIENLKNIIRI